MLDFTSPSSSLESLQSALAKSDRTSRLLLSPTSAATGVTGSSEEPHSASRSLANSVAGHSDDPASDEFDDGPDSDIEPGYATPSASSKRALSPTLGSHAPSRRNFAPSAAESDASWSQFSCGGREKEQSPFVVPGVDQMDHPYIKEEERSEDGRNALRSSTEEVEGDSRREDYCLPITDSQAEAADYALRTTRSQSDFSHWLADTIAHARGDGESTIDSEDAYSSIAAVTRQARMGLGAAMTSNSVAGSDRVRVAFDSSISDLHHFETSPSLESLVDEEEQLLKSDTMPIKLDDTIEIEAAPAGAAPAATSVDGSGAQPAEPLLAPSQLRWKVATAFLAVAWVSSSIYPRLALLISSLWVRPSLLVEEMPALGVANTTLTIQIAETATPSLPLGHSFALYTTPFIVFCLFVAVTKGHCADEEEPIKRSRSRSSSPLLELNPSAIDEARSLLPAAIEAYHSSRLAYAIDSFGYISHLACAPADKASACEWLGRAQYRLARLSGDRDLLEESVRSFERAVRMDGSSATARASLGRAQFRLGEKVDAVKHLAGAIKRNAELAYAHEYLGKAYASLDGKWTLAEDHLRRAIVLDCSSYTSLAFLGEQLHTRGRTSEGCSLLEQAVAVRVDYPAAHARLAFIATEQLGSARAAKHLSLVLSTRDTGFFDGDLLESTTASVLGSTPFLSLFFAIPSTDPSARLAVLDRATKLYSTSTLLHILHLITRRQSRASPVRACLDPLRELEGTLAKRVARFGAEDLEGKGLWALCLLGLNSKKSKKVYAEFWAEMKERKSTEERELAFLVMAFYDLKAVRQDSGARRKEL